MRPSASSGEAKWEKGQSPEVGMRNSEKKQRAERMAKSLEGEKLGR
ncbi:hypothetical protein D1AOALGA4SA_5685 [Olavius algarvensis Delta 1 endosymbiont]|nr:hypothetical protein D1AOALGA4SA_5685 [Olavius algarvensis Delta 1 endosymbiont]